MTNYAEKRQYPRYAYETPLYFYKEAYKTPYSKAVMNNYSREGMYFQTDEKLQVGDHVYVRIENYDGNAAGPEKYRVYSGYVRWSEELGTSYPNGNYGYGIQYPDPVYY